MKITVLDALEIPAGKGATNLTGRYREYLVSQGHEVTVFNLNEMSINHCLGCWTCWWKTPGYCAINDDMPTIYRSVMASDLLVFMSPLKKGFVNGITRKATERLIPLLHPYVTVVEGELHHIKRYPEYPPLGLIVEKESDTDEEDLDITRDLYRRFALNFRSNLKFFTTTDKLFNGHVNETHII